MTLQASGAISMSQINTELGTAVNDLLHPWIRLLANIPSGPVRFSSVYSQTGHYTGTIQSSASLQSIGLNAAFFGAITQTMLRNASNGNIELDFNSAPRWQSTIFLINNTTGISSILSPVNAQGWQGANPANLWRVSQSDNFTFRPI